MQSVQIAICNCSAFIQLSRSISVFFQLTDLFALSVRGGVVCDLEVIEVEYVLHLIVVASSLANYDSHVEQKYVSVK